MFHAGIDQLRCVLVPQAVVGHAEITGNEPQCPGNGAGRPRKTAHVQVAVDFPGSPTDHAIVAVYTTLNGSCEVRTSFPIMEFLIENTTDPNGISFLVTGLYKFGVGVRPPRLCSRCYGTDVVAKPEGQAVAPDELMALADPSGAILQRLARSRVRHRRRQASNSSGSGRSARGKHEGAGNDDETHERDA